MRTKLLLIMGVLLFFAGCTANNASSTVFTNATDTICSSSEDICVIGTPGLLSENSVYSSSDTYFSIILRNNLGGQEAKDVEVELKNIGPFKIVEGYNTAADIASGTCGLSVGVWAPYTERTIFNSPDPQFVDDFGLPFSKHKLGVMYPDEEIEFLWRLRSPSYQEIANVAYPHSFSYTVSYDYKTGVIQTVYALSEDEYQRIIRVEGKEPTTTGTMTSSVGALEIERSVAEPVRIQGSGSQFTLTYKVSNKRSGTPLEPAMFVLQIPDGAEHVGLFDSVNSLAQTGYLDLLQAVKYYNSTVGLEGDVCIPSSFDGDSEILYPTGIITTGCQGAGFALTKLSNILAYLKGNFPDLQIDYYAPKIVIKFIYPNDLKSEINYLYYPLKTTESVNISKYYTFRLKTKYRYSFSGDEDTLIVPNAASFDTGASVSVGLMWGNIKPLWAYKADSASYSASGKELNMSKGGVLLHSYVRDLGNNAFLHIVGLENTNAASEVPCTTDADCTPNRCVADKCQVCTGADDSTCTPYLNSHYYYGMDVGYNTMDSHTERISQTGATLLDVPSGKTLYFYNEFPYSSMTSQTAANRQAGHTISSLDGKSISEISSIVGNFVDKRAFFEVRDAGGIILSDNDLIGARFDVNAYASQSSSSSTPAVPVTMNLLSSLDNETLFRFSPSTNSELVGVFASPVDGQIPDTLVLYFFNDDSSKIHSFTMNVSMANATTVLTGTKIETNTVRIFTNMFYSLSTTTAPTRTVVAGGYKKYSLNLENLATNSGYNIIGCYSNINSKKPVLVIDWLDEVRTGDNLETIESSTEGSIIVGDYASYAAAAAAYGGNLGLSANKKFYNGVANSCYLSE